MKKGYVLEDLYTALQARLAKVEAEVQQINAGWERTSLMLSSALLRAEAAEARVKELVEALDNLLEAITASDQIGDRRLTITGPTANLRRLLDACVDARATLAAMEKEKADE
jgi:actin-like ATPase involved in cell morphogenesis